MGKFFFFVSFFRTTQVLKTNKVDLFVINFVLNDKRNKYKFLSYVSSI